MRSCANVPCHVSIRFMVSGWKGHLSIYCLVCRSQLSLRQNTTMTVEVSGGMLNTVAGNQKEESWDQRHGKLPLVICTSNENIIGKLTLLCIYHIKHSRHHVLAKLDYKNSSNNNNNVGLFS